VRWVERRHHPARRSSRSHRQPAATHPPTGHSPRVHATPSAAAAASHAAANAPWATQLPSHVSLSHLGFVPLSIIRMVLTGMFARGLEIRRRKMVVYGETRSLFYLQHAEGTAPPAGPCTRGSPWACLRIMHTHEATHAVRRRVRGDEGWAERRASGGPRRSRRRTRHCERGVYVESPKNCATRLVCMRVCTTAGRVAQTCRWEVWNVNGRSRLGCNVPSSGA